MARICPMPESLARLVAAEEVVLRPASVVKELVENAMDADATDVGIEIERGGIARIRVSDNGKGIDPDDVVLAFQRYATSKLFEEDDLGRIHTFGFRGEALASVLECARVSLQSKTQDDDVGVEIRGAFGVLESPQPQARRRGTTVVVEQLFARIPARLEYLKSPASESTACLQSVRRAALARPDVGFRFSTDGRDLLDVAPAPHRLDRIEQMYGPAFRSSLIPVEREAAGVRVHGFVSQPDACPRRATKSVIFVNGRPIESSRIRGAVRQAFRDLIVGGRHPEMILAVEVATHEVDANVAPDKSEVRLLHEDRVASLAYRAVQHALAEPQGSVPTGQNAPRESPAAWGSGGPMAQAAPTPEATTADPSLFSSSAFGGDSESEPSLSAAPVPIAQLDNTLLLVPVEGGVLYVDQHSLHERILYEQLKAQSGEVVSQALLVPERFPVPDADTMLALEGLDEPLRASGFEIAPAGPREFWIHATPAWTGTRSPSRALADAVAALSREVRLHSDADEVMDALFSRIACRSAVMAGQPLDDAAMRALWRRGQDIDLSLLDIHGRPGAVFMAFEQLYRKLGR